LPVAWHGSAAWVVAIAAAAVVALDYRSAVVVRARTHPAASSGGDSQTGHCDKGISEQAAHDLTVLSQAAIERREENGGSANRRKCQTRSGTPGEIIGEQWRARLTILTARDTSEYR